LERISEPKISDSWEFSTASNDVRKAGVEVSFRLDDTIYVETLHYIFKNGQWVLTRGLLGSLSVSTLGSQRYVPFFISDVDSDEGQIVDGTRHTIGFLVFPAVYHITPRVDPTWSSTSLDLEDVSDGSPTNFTVKPCSRSSLLVSADPSYPK